MIDEFECSVDAETVVLLCQRNELERLTIDIRESSDVESLIKCLNQAKNLVTLQINYLEGTSESRQIENIFKNLHAMHILFNH